jgi:hypothetical protein
MIPTTNEFLDMLVPEEKKQYRLGKIDSAYVSGQSKVIFDGESVASGKSYPRLGSYTPLANDRVLMLCISGSYVILGKII